MGFLVTTLLALLPSVVLGTAVAATFGHGPTVSTNGLWEAVLLLSVLGVVAYGATFLLLGLLTRFALVIGLIYGFLWEAFVSLIPGPIGQWTVVYYLRDVGAQLVSSGSLGSSTSTVSVAGVLVGFVVFAVASLTVASIVLRYTESRPAAAPT